jgi:hypothetical protein
VNTKGKRQIMIDANIFKKLGKIKHYEYNKQKIKKEK